LLGKLLAFSAKDLLMNSRVGRHIDAPVSLLRQLPLSICRPCHHPLSLAGLAILVWQLCGGPVCAQSAVADEKQVDAKLKVDEPALGTDWVRLKHDESGQIIGMQTAIVRYTRPVQSNGKFDPNGSSTKPAATPDNITVDLIGAVHIADIPYYRDLNERFKQYDAVLYELVAPEGTVVERGRGTSNTHPVGAMQNAIKSFLALDHQLEYVDYTKSNFVHADLSPDQFLQAMRDRNESFLQLYFRMMGQAMSQQSDMAARGDSPDLDLFAALFSKDRPRRLKIVLAKQLAEMESLLVSLGGEQGTVLISERNKRALDVLRMQLNAGKKKIGIFYGAGHLADMDQRLRKDFGLEPVEITWLTAWSLAAKP
jgi:hypothetical protein